MEQGSSRVLEILTGFEIVPIGEDILRRASDAFPTSLGSLDAIHLASALVVRDQVSDLALATHDLELAKLTVARKIAAIVQHMWKEQEVYRDETVNTDAAARAGK